jgi:hypothetical protein
MLGCWGIFVWGNRNDETVGNESIERLEWKHSRSRPLLNRNDNRNESSYSRANVKTKSQSSSSTVVGAFFWAKARWRHAAGYSAIDNASITAFTIHEVTTDGDGAGAPSQVSLRGEALTLIFISIGDLR